MQVGGIAVLGGLMDSQNPVRTLRILVENRHGALLKIVGVFTTRAYNIDSLHVMPDREEEISQMTVALRCDARQCELLRKQLLKIVDVVDVQEEEPRDETPSLGDGGYSHGNRVLRAAR